MISKRTISMAIALAGLLVLAPTCLSTMRGCGELRVPFLHPAPNQRARIRTAKTQLDGFQEELDRYTRDNGRPPTTDQGLAALVRRPLWGPPSRRWRQYDLAIPLDPWDRPYHYVSPGRRGERYVVTSFGTDGRPGGTGDAADLAVAAARR